MPVRVTGAQETADQLERLAAEAEELDALRDAGDLTRAQLEVLSPYRTGELAGSWQVVGQGLEIQVGSDLVHAAIQNYGSRYVTGQRFVERAAELVADEAGRLVTDEIDRLIGRL